MGPESKDLPFSTCAYVKLKEQNQTQIMGQPTSQISESGLQN
jgi:hypothetical protein